MLGHTVGGNDPERLPDAARSGQAIDGLAMSAAGIVAARTAISDLAGSEHAAREESDRDRPPVGTETGEIQRQRDAVDQERAAPLTGTASDNPRLPSLRKVR
jgi:hypothetical protein